MSEGEGCGGRVMDDFIKYCFLTRSLGALKAPTLRVQPFGLIIVIMTMIASYANDDDRQDFHLHDDGDNCRIVRRMYIQRQYMMRQKFYYGRTRRF